MTLLVPADEGRNLRKYWTALLNPAMKPLGAPPTLTVAEFHDRDLYSAAES